MMRAGLHAELRPDLVAEFATREVDDNEYKKHRTNLDVYGYTIVTGLMRHGCAAAKRG